MELDVSVDKKSLSITITDPFHLDIEAIVRQIESFLTSQGTSGEGLDFRSLLPKMVRGIAGCEGGCPADAQNFVSRGFPSFKLEYIEGGILQAKALAGNGKAVSVRIFPEF